MIVVRVISLRRSSARRAAMQAQLDSVPGLNWSFFDACEVPLPELPYDSQAALRCIRRPMTAGELGCFASHYALWQWLGEQPAGTVIVVIEDDLLIDPGFFGDLAAICTAARVDYLRLHAKAPVAARVVGRIAGRHLVRYRGLAFGTQAYILRQTGAARFCASIRRIERPVDDEMDRYWAHRVANMGLFPFPVIEVAGTSTIESARRMLPPPRWNEFGWQLRRIGESFRRRFANLWLDLGGTL